MDELNQKINALYGSIEKMIHLQQQLLIENHKMLELNQELIAKIEDQNLTIHQLDEKLKAAKLVQAITSNRTDIDKTDLLIQIDNFINQIDTCMKQLSNEKHN
ncbi:MAG: hypothetical protein JNK61_05265 [Bacteroidia bacterium]|nr:hypothetical protein [Bacteroidia bacterium]HQV00194.1 hypothetical protein [Bacteroidia bacterium]